MIFLRQFQLDQVLDLEAVEIFLWYKSSLKTGTKIKQFYDFNLFRIIVHVIYFQSAQYKGTNQQKVCAGLDDIMKNVDNSVTKCGLGKNIEKAKAAALRLLLPKETKNLKNCQTYQRILANNPKPSNRAPTSPVDQSSLQTYFDQLKSGQTPKSSTSLAQRGFWSWVKRIVVIAIAIIVIVGATCSNIQC